MKSKKSKLRVGLVVPHMFMHEDIFPNVIFSPGHLAINLSNGLVAKGHDVYFFSPGGVGCTDGNLIKPDFSYFEWELKQRGYGYMELFKKHPLTFITLARQAQCELISRAYQMLNNNELDVIHIYCNEEDTALRFSSLTKKNKVIFTHHEPFNYLAKYRSSFPKFKDLNWVSFSYAQRESMPKDTNFIRNIYHGLSTDEFKYTSESEEEYILYMGRIIKPKGVHLAIQACKKASVKLKIAGKHYNDSNDNYWESEIKPHIDGKEVECLGFISSNEKKQNLLGNAKALIIPSIWQEPFGMVMIEALACGTPVIGLKNGAIPEVIDNGRVGFIVESTKTSLDELDENTITDNLAKAIIDISCINRKTCREIFEQKFTVGKMVKEYEDLYLNIV